MSVGFIETIELVNKAEANQLTLYVTAFLGDKENKLSIETQALVQQVGENVDKYMHTWTLDEQAYFIARHASLKAVTNMVRQRALDQRYWVNDLLRK